MTARAPLDAPIKRLVVQEIERFGPMSYERFIDIALYHPRYGYYNAPGPRRGRAGDYFTSLQVSRLFPEIFAEALLQLKETLGTEQFSLVEIGSGGGEFLDGVLNALAGAGRLKGFRVWAVERSRPARDALWRILSRFPRCSVVSSMDEIEWMGGLEGCIFSNEFFDAVPFYRLRFSNGAWRELRVGTEGGELVDVLTPLSRPDLAPVGGDWTEGHTLEARPGLADLYRDWAVWLTRGTVLTVDYGHPRAALRDPARARGTALAFYQHEARENLLADPGRQDLTAHVDFTQLAEAGSAAGFDPGLFCSQGLFLSYVGAGRIETFLKEPGADLRRRAGEVQQLIHPNAMGERFWVLAQTKGVALPPAWGEIPNRLRRLGAAPPAPGFLV